MPYVNVKITKGGVTAAQKKKLVEDITSSLVSTLGKRPEHIHIVIDEIDPENWGFAGRLTTEYLAQPRPRPKPRCPRKMPIQAPEPAPRSAAPRASAGIPQ